MLEQGHCFTETPTRTSAESIDAIESHREKKKKNNAQTVSDSVSTFPVCNLLFHSLTSACTLNITHILNVSWVAEALLTVTHSSVLKFKRSVRCLHSEFDCFGLTEAE